MYRMFFFLCTGWDSVISSIILLHLTHLRVLQISQRDWPKRYMAMVGVFQAMQINYWSKEDGAV